MIKIIDFEIKNIVALQLLQKSQSMLPWQMWLIVFVLFSLFM